MTADNQEKGVDSKKPNWGLITGVLSFFLILLFVVVVDLCYDKDSLEKDKKDLQEQITQLTVEKFDLENSLSYYKALNYVGNSSENSPEMEALNSIANAIADSKKTEVNIETKNGNIHFIYEGK